MSGSRIQRIFRRWLRITILSILMIVSGLLLLVFFLLIFQVPSFAIGTSTLWVMRWQNPPGVPFSVTWNAIPLLIMAATIGLIGVLLPRQSHLNRSGK